MWIVPALSSVYDWMGEDDKAAQRTEDNLKAIDAGAVTIAASDYKEMTEYIKKVWKGYAFYYAKNKGE